ncbi:MAG: hypothetical protein HRT44_07200, partial [Bdellovibrionales bacterium]|nr:hypothetical protein [Bdellovibrionales bacterium]NQZ19023.1 hypothetical protein [Bdellovibrionales bacterium]
MISSKKLLSFLLPLLFVFTACVKADRQSEADTMLNQFSMDKSLIDFNNRALFEAGNIELEDIQFVHSGVRAGENGQTVESAWKAPDRIRLFFKLCGIRDRASQGTIRGEKFHISSEIGSDINDESTDGRLITNPVTVNNGNCLRWSQFVPNFNYVAPSHNLVLHYEFESLAGGMGRIIRRVGFNPWDMHRNESRRKVIFDLTDFNRQDWHEGRWVVGEADIIKALKGELVEGESRLEISSLQIQPVESEANRTADYNNRLAGLTAEERQARESIEAALIDTQNRQGGMFLNINMTALPFVRVTDATGLVHDENITTGRFRIFMNLIASGGADNPEKVLISHNMYNRTGLNASAYTWEMTTNGLQASLPVLLNRIPRDGSISLALK